MVWRQPQGGLLLIDEVGSDREYRALERRARRWHRVLCLVREFPDRISTRFPIPSMEYVWLVKGNDGSTVSPLSLPGIHRAVEQFVDQNPGGTVILDGVELLMVLNSYQGIKGLLLSLDRTLRAHRASGVVPINLRTLTLGELRDLKAAFHASFGKR